MTKEKIIIVAEDDDSLRSFYKEFLPFFLPGVRIYSYPDGEKALAKIKEGAVADLLLMDYQMPVMDGLELAREAKRINPGLKILMVSGDPPPIPQAQEAGVNKVLLKPTRDLAGEIKKMLDLCPV